MKKYSLKDMTSIGQRGTPILNTVNACF